MMYGTNAGRQDSTIPNMSCSGEEDILFSLSAARLGDGLNSHRILSKMQTVSPWSSL